MTIQSITRNIQYFGLLRPPSDQKIIKWWRLTADIIRPQLSIYRNDRYPTPQGFWGYVQSMYAGRVLHTYRISYENEILAYNIDTDLFLQQNISCSLEAVLTSFVNLANGLNLIPFERNNPIKDWRNLSLPIDEFRIRLIAENTVFKITYDWEEQENCSVPFSETPIPPPPPPPPINQTPQFPPNTPNSGLPPISDAYDGVTDNNLTYKPDPEPPITEDCLKYDVTIRAEFRQSNADNQAQTGVFRVWGPIGNVRVNTLPQVFSTSVLLTCKGFVTQPCSNVQEVVTLDISGNPNSDPLRGFVNAQILVVEQIP